MMNSVKRTYGNGQKFSDKDCSSASMTLRDGNNLKASFKDYEVRPFARRNSNHRCGGYFTLLSLDPNGHWRAIAVPFDSLNLRINAGSKSQSFTDGTSSGPRMQYHSRSKALTNKTSRKDVLLSKPIGHPSFNNNSFNVSNITNITDIHNGKPKMGKLGKKNNKKGKNGKKDPKLSLDAGSTDVACSKTTDRGTGSTSWETASTLLSPDSCSNSSEDNSYGLINYSEESKDNTTNFDVVDTSEVTYGAQTSTFSSDLSASGRVHDTLHESVSSVKDASSNVLSEVNESPIPVCSKVDVTISSSSSRDMRREDTRTVPRDSSVYKKSSLRKSRGHSTEKNYTSWREVSGNGTDKCRSVFRKANSFDSQDVHISKVFAKRNHHVSQSKLISKGEDAILSKVSNPGKLKKKTSAGSKQERNCHSRKFPYASKSTSNLCTDIGTELNNAVDILPYLGQKKSLVGISRPLSNVDLTRTESEPGNFDSITGGHACQLEGQSRELESLEQIYSPSSSSLNYQTMRQECKSIAHHFEDRNQTELFDGKTTAFFKLTETEGLGRGKHVSAIENNLHDQVSGPSMPKWIPIGIKDPGLQRSDLSNSLHCIDTEAADLKLECFRRDKDVSAVEENKQDQIYGSSMHKSACLKDSELARPDIANSSQSVDFKAVNNFKSENTAIATALSIGVDSAVSLGTTNFGTENDHHSNAEIPICNVSAETAVSNDSIILQAVNDAYKAQLASEAVEKAIGFPVAELERFLHAASPVILLPDTLSHCRTCLGAEVSGTPLCRHKMPNLSLGNMWQWYEKHGTFGLEVKAEEYDNSKRLGIDRSKFCAYFVPFLSAVQLFRRSSSSDNCKKVLDAHKGCKLAENSSTKVGLQIFSVLVPQPKKACNVTEENNDSTRLDESDLVYEYFEAERPQHRRPLFEMINNLVSGNEPLQGKAFGDPSKLVSMEINDLHPKSWYSVAWYPIYRIPDEKFQSAFLTYHSLGHLVHGSTPSVSATGNACVVSPVVGLRSYNTQGECWLRPRNLLEEIPNHSCSEILKERLTTLEHTASVMARAEVVKGIVSSFNMQPDYEFFLSRRCW